MPDLFWEGVSLSIIGITLTFLALGLLILATVVLERLFRPPATERTVALDRGGNAAEETVAAIAVALVLAEHGAGSDPRLGAALTADRSPWWRAPVRAPRRERRTSRHPGSVA